MSQPQTTLFQTESIARPTCSRCGSSMWLTRIRPVAAGVERRIFKCPVCDIAELAAIPVSEAENRSGD